MKPILLFISMLFFASSIQSQSNYPQNYFRSPIDFRILPSGTFGELRPNHFHTGLDIKTRGAEGASVYASADAYVSRIKISAFGTGKTLYLTHPNGYVSVYGHLSKLDTRLTAYVKMQQYKLNSFEVDLYLDKDQFVYAKGEVIAFTGNSGSSGGPHLHFEIRDEATQEPINPLLFGLEVKDYIRPTIHSIRVYPTGKKPFNLELGGWGENYYLKSGDTIGLPSTFYLGISALDKQNDTQNNNGVFEVELYLDTTKIYGNRQERLNFSTGRYINAFIDYPYYIQHNSRYQRSYVGENNKLKIYTPMKGNGMIHLSDKGFHQLSYVVKDASGNTSRLKFYAFAVLMDTYETIPPEKGVSAVFYAENENVFEAENFEISLPADALYDSLYFHFDILPIIKKSYTPIYRVHQNKVPLQKYIFMSIKAQGIPESLKPKIMIARVVNENFIAYPSTWEGSWATASIRDFGNYTLVADTLKPQIRWVGSAKSTGITKGSKISFIIKDDLSGIKNYSGYFNNEWVLFEYDAKNNVIFHYVEQERLKNENILRIEVEDMVGNKSILERNFNKI